MLLAFLQTDATKVAAGLWSVVATPVIIILVVLAIGALLRTLSKRYVKVPPEQALIIFGGGKTRVMSGGAKFILPLVEDFYHLDLSLFQFEVELKEVPNKDNVPITLSASVSAKISNKADMLPVAAGMFGRTNLSGITQKVKGIVDGIVRALIGQSSMETILRDMDQFKQSIQAMVQGELAKTGCEIVALNIQQVSDPNGVIKALGIPEIARVKAEAAIQEAEQTRRQTIETTNAKREAQKVAAGNDAQIAEANRDLEVKKAGYSAEVARQQATAAQAGPLADAEARKAVVVAQVVVKEAQTEAETRLQAKVKERTRAELDATVLVQADAEKQRSVIVAEGTRQATVITAEGNQRKLVIEAEGSAEARKKIADAERTALEAEGQGEAAKSLAVGNAAATVARVTGEGEAAATQARMLAEAAGQTAQAAATKARLLAEAEGQTAQAAARRAELLAHAAGVEAELLAQATGAQALVDTFKGLTSQQTEMLRIKWILEALPGAIKELGEAGERIMGRVAEPIAAALGSIDNITVYDSGAGGASGASGLERYAKLGPQALMHAFMSLRETGMLPVVMGALKKAGVDVSSLLSGSAGDDGAAAAAAAG